MYKSLVLCKFSRIFFVWKALFSLSVSDGRRGLSFTSSQNCLSDRWGQRELCVDLLLFSRCQQAVIKIYEPSLQGMGVYIQANVAACPLLLYHPVRRATAESRWSPEKQAFSWKSIGNWLGNWELRLCDIFPVCGWRVFNIQATLLHSFSLHLRAFLHERGICLVLPSSDWYRTHFISLGFFYFPDSWRDIRPSSVACDFLTVHILFE